MHFKYCPHCGEKLDNKKIGDEGMIPYCEACKTPFFDTFKTCVIVAVVNEYGEIALLRQSYVSKDTYVCVAGIMKPDESAEDAVRREVKEEIGQDAEGIEYIGSYPYPGKEMLMLGFKARVKKKELMLSCEVDSAEWFTFADAPSKLRDGSIAKRLVECVIEEAKNE